MLERDSGASGASRAAVVQWIHLSSGDREIPKHTGSNPSDGLRGHWASTLGYGSQTAGLLDVWSSFGGL